MLLSVVKVLSGVAIFMTKHTTVYNNINLKCNISYVYKMLHANSSTLSKVNITVSQALQQWQNKFETNEIPEAQLSILNILAHILGYHEVYKVNLVLEKTLLEDQVQLLNNLCECRLARMPIQYIIKEWDFRDLRLSMCPPVFIPRSETEELIDLISNKVHHCKTFLEVGCGSGAISLSLLQSLPEAKAVAIDQSITACKLTLENAKKHNLLDRIDVLHCKLNDDGSLNKTLPMNGFDILVSNPPYVPLKQILNLEPEIKLYEDLRALEAGKDGLRVIKALFVLAQNVLKQNGDVFLEVDSSHPPLIQSLLQRNSSYGLEFIEYFKDIYGRDRFVHLKKI